ncbi:MAG: prepilin-type N-terminal cleavage/methylation domain-containing protein, partial [Fibrobacter sp.]|nr:prepilin-type N-terminal cleavage/methylation domain-containing protein [Fibrobacter sp.]
MKKNGTLKAGYTLVEMLTVVAIMGILAGVGVSGFQTAVQNGRIKDAGINVTA